MIFDILFVIFLYELVNLEIEKRFRFYNLKLKQKKDKNEDNFDELKNDGNVSVLKSRFQNLALI